MKYSNPARRLHTLLTLGREISSDYPCKSAWGDLLGVPEGSPELLRKLAKVMMLPEQILEVVEKEFPARVAMQKHWAGPVRVGFENQNLSGAWQTFNGQIKESVVDFLAMTSDLIEERVAPDDISDDQLSEFRDRFQVIQSDLVESDLPDGVKKHLSRAISRILMAFDDYKLSGSYEMLASIDMALGKAIYDVEYRESLSNSKVGKDFLDAINTVASVVTIVSGVPLLTESIGRLIGN